MMADNDGASCLWTFGIAYFWYRITGTSCLWMASQNGLKGLKGWSSAPGAVCAEGRSAGEAAGRGERVPSPGKGRGVST
jgi:hypothetical protein